MTIGNVSVPSGDTLTGASSLLAALADPEGTAKKLQQLKDATEAFLKAKEESLSAGVLHAAKEKALAALEAELSSRRIAVEAGEKQNADRQSMLSKIESDLQTRAAALEADAKAKLADIEQKAKALATRETTLNSIQASLASREATIATQEQELAARLQKLKAAML